MPARYQNRNLRFPAVMFVGIMFFSIFASGMADFEPFETSSVMPDMFADADAAAPVLLDTAALTESFKDLNECHDKISFQLQSILANSRFDLKSETLGVFELRSNDPNIALVTRCFHLAEGDVRVFLSAASAHKVALGQAIGDLYQLLIAG